MYARFRFLLQVLLSHLTTHPYHFLVLVLLELPGANEAIKLVKREAAAVDTTRECDHFCDRRFNPSANYFQNDTENGNGFKIKCFEDDTECTNKCREECVTLCTSTTGDSGKMTFQYQINCPLHRGSVNRDNNIRDELHKSARDEAVCEGWTCGWILSGIISTLLILILCCYCFIMKRGSREDLPQQQPAMYTMPAPMITPGAPPELHYNGASGPNFYNQQQQAHPISQSPPSSSGWGAY